MMIETKTGRTLQMVPGICKTSNGTPFSPLTSTKTIKHNGNQVLETVLDGIKGDINGIIGGGGGGISLPALQELISQLQREKVAKAGDTMTGNLTTPNLYATNVHEGNVLLSNKYAPKVHSHGDLYYTETEINNILANYYTKTESDGRFAPNNGLASTAEAQAGTNTTKYMTPARTKEAILATSSQIKHGSISSSSNLTISTTESTISQPYHASGDIFISGTDKIAESGSYLITTQLTDVFYNEYGVVGYNGVGLWIHMGPYNSILVDNSDSIASNRTLSYITSTKVFNISAGTSLGLKAVTNKGTARLKRVEITIVKIS